MISSGTSMGATLYKIPSISNKKSYTESISPSCPISPFRTHKSTKYINPFTNTNKSSIIDLMKQSKLTNDPPLLFNRNYYINLLKLQLKKNKDKKSFPALKTVSSIKSIPIFNFNSYNTLTTSNFPKDKYIKTYSYKNLNHKKCSFLYKKMKGGVPENLKFVYVNKFLTSKDISEDDKMQFNNKNIKNEADEKITIKNKIENNNYNLNLSKLRFLMFHGFNKKNKGKQDKYNSMEKCVINKYEGLDNKKIRQYFLKRKLKNINTKMKSAEKDVENAKNNLNVLFTYINREIESKLNEEYKK